MERMGLGYEVLRGAAPRRHHDRALRLRRDRPGARQGVVRPGAGAALGPVVGHRLPRPSADARRHLVRRSHRRPARRGRRARRAAASRAHRQRPVHRSLAVGDDDGRPPGGDRRVHDERRSRPRATATAIRTWRRTACSAPPARIAGSPSPIEDDAAWRRFAQRHRTPGAGRRPALRHPRRPQAPRGRARGAGDGVDRDAGRRRRRSPRSQAAGIPAFVAATNRDIAEDPHLAARGFLVTLPHPEVGALMHLGDPVAHVGERQPRAPRGAVPRRRTPTTCCATSAATRPRTSSACAPRASSPRPAARQLGRSRSSCGVRKPSRTSAGR